MAYVSDNESRRTAVEFDIVFVLRAASQMRVPKTSVFADGNVPTE